MGRKILSKSLLCNGEKLGSHENDECKIDLISQSFSILSDVCPEDKVTSVIILLKKT